MFHRVEVRALAGPIKDIQKPRSHSCFVLAVSLGSLSCRKVNLRPSLRSWALWSRFHQGSLCTLLCSYFPPYKLLPFKNDRSHCVLGDLQLCRYFLVPFRRSVPQHNPVSELYGQFLRHHGLVFALTCTVNCGTLCRQVCAFPNHVQSIEFTTVGL
jgi:hypothetical protein